MKARVAYVYGLFAGNGTCYYVGVTRAPKLRLTAHRNTTLKRRRFSMRIIRPVPVSEGLRIESQVIAAYRRRGEAKYNRTPVDGAPVTQVRRSPAMPKSDSLPAARYDSKGKVLVRIAMPKVLLKWLRARAAENMRTLPSQIIRILREKLESTEAK